MADNRYCRIRDRIGVDPLSEWGCRSGRNAKAPERAARTFRGLHRRSGSLFRAVEEAGQDAVVFFGFFGNLPIRGDIDMDEIKEKAKKAAGEAAKVGKEVAKEAVKAGKEAARVGKEVAKAAVAGIKAGVAEGRKAYEENKKK